MMNDLTNEVIKDLKKLESDRKDKEGGSQNRKLWPSESWLESAYYNTLKTAIELKKLLNES